MKEIDEQEVVKNVNNKKCAPQMILFVERIVLQRF